MSSLRQLSQYATGFGGRGSQKLRNPTIHDIAAVGINCQAARQ
jgi:hypothetical protein